MARPLVRDEEGLSTLGSFIGVVILVIAILGAYYGVVVPKFGPPPIRTQTGDSVTVDYIGTFADNGLVFDTSLAAVAHDNASFPKSFTFGWRASWQALGPFTIGTGAVVRGFDIGVQGLALHETKTIVVPPELGYGPADPTKFVVKPLFESVPVRITTSAEDFSVTYGVAPTSGSNVTDPFWGWSAYVSVSGSVVTVTNSPFPGQLLKPYGAWDATVVRIDDGANGGAGAILVHHLLDPSVVDRTGQQSQGRTVFVVSAVDLEAGTYTLNYNVSVPAGRTLVFQVTMVDISRPF